MKSHARTMQNLTMQRRHFQLIAEALLAERPVRDGTPWADGARDEWSTIVLRFAGVLSSTNPKFDRQYFIEACGFERSKDISDDEPKEVNDRGAAFARRVRGF